MQKENTKKSLLFDMPHLCHVIETERFYFMGVAILLVIVYHYQGSVYSIKNELLHFFVGRGFVGVDIFLFFSALGCSYSYTRNSLLKFYRNRAKRILPLFFVICLYRIALYVYSGESLSVLKVLCAFSTVSYYIGGLVVDWYLSALIAFYILFPFLFVFVKKTGMWGMIMVCIGITVVLGCIELQWSHEAFFARIPIFLLGIYYYSKGIGKHFAVVLLLYIIAGIVVSPELSLFLKYTFLSPLVIIVLAWLFDVFSRVKWLYSFISFCGKHSLEIYLANITTSLGVRLVDSASEKSVVYFLMNIIVACILYFCNKGIIVSNDSLCLWFKRLMIKRDV